MALGAGTLGLAGLAFAGISAPGPTAFDISVPLRTRVVSPVPFSLGVALRTRVGTGLRDLRVPVRTRVHLPPYSLSAPLRTRVAGPAAFARPAFWRTRVIIDGVDWSSRVTGEVLVDGEESAARVAELARLGLAIDVLNGGLAAWRTSGNPVPE